MKADTKIPTKVSPSLDKNTISNHFYTSKNDNMNDSVAESMVNSYVDNSTVHGIKYVKSRNRIRRWTWGLVCAGMAIGLTVTVVIYVIKLLQYPSVTKTTFEWRNFVRFPAVTICNLNQVRKSYVDDEYAEVFMLNAATSPIMRFFNMFNLSNPLFNIKFNDLLSEKQSAILIREKAHQLNTTLVRCTLYNQLRNCSDLFETIVTDFGVCYTYNSKFVRKQKAPYIVRVPGSKYGLGVVANINHDEYVLGENNDAAGLRVVLHDFNQTPIVQSNGFNVGPGFSTFASIEQHEVFHLESPYRIYGNKTCSKTDNPSFSFPLKYSKTYDYNQCIWECKTTFITGKCKCKNMYDFAEVNFTFCSGREYLECFLPANDEFHRSIIQMCDCPVPCTYTYYKETLSSAWYPSKAIKQGFETFQVDMEFSKNQSMDQYRENMLELRVFYANFKVTKTEQLPEYDFEKIMGTIGGQMGIFLGASIMSVVELVEFVSSLLVARWRRWKIKRKQVADKGNE